VDAQWQGTMRQPILYETAAPTRSGYRDVTPAALHASLGNVRVVDVREPHELVGELGRIPGVDAVPVGAVGQCAAEWDRDQDIVLVCHSGGRSGRAAEMLARAGFRRVMNLAGGMLAYRAAGLPVVRG
jgi:sulfur-carrier protein adenylyltransferase/sulfurtransferase